MIYKNNNKIIGAFYGNVPIIKVYLLNTIVWKKLSLDDLILSCYSNGYWIDEYPWIDDLPWID